MSIRQAISKVVEGQLRIPKFQRGFVWDAERVAYLMDSIYKGYPFGSLILWRTRTPLKTEKKLGPYGAEVRSRFDEIKNGLHGAIDFLKNSLHVQKLENLPYPTLLIPLAKFFATPDGKDVKVTARQREELVTWFWRAAISRRFSGDVQRRLNVDLAEAETLRLKGKSALADVPATISDDWFLDNTFGLKNVNTKTFILMLAAARPKTFVSGAAVSLSDVLKAYNRPQFHHLYPRGYLKSTGRTNSDDASRLANFAMISAADNRAISSRAPSKYQSMIGGGDPVKLARILSGSLCTPILFLDDYDTFLADRAKRLTEHAKKLARIK